MMSKCDQIYVRPVVINPSLRTLAYDALKVAISGIDIYGTRDELRLDERRLARDFGISRTPIREAIAVLEHEGLVKSRARHGIFIVKKNKKEIVEIIHTWTALESMAARLACVRASSDQLKSFRNTFPQFYVSSSNTEINEYSEANLRFHQEIIALGQCETISKLSSNLLMHVRSIRGAALRHDDRVSRSLQEHVQIIDALEAHDAELAGRLVREHGLGLAEHVSAHGDYLENTTSTPIRVSSGLKMTFEHHSILRQD